MSLSRFALVCTVLLSSASTWALGVPLEEENGLLLHSTLGGVASAPSSVPAVKPGDVFGITGECISRAKAADDVRVVFALDDARGGYKAVLATEQEQDDGVLQVRVPDLPGVTDRNAEVQVFVVGRGAPVVCNAGTIHIG